MGGSGGAQPERDKRANNSMSAGGGDAPLSAVTLDEVRRAFCYQFSPDNPPQITAEERNKVWKDIRSDVQNYLASSGLDLSKVKLTPVEIIDTREEERDTTYLLLRIEDKETGMTILPRIGRLQTALATPQIEQLEFDHPFTVDRGFAGLQIFLTPDGEGGNNLSSEYFLSRDVVARDLARLEGGQFRGITGGLLIDKFSGMDDSFQIERVTTGVIPGWRNDYELFIKTDNKMCMRVSNQEWSLTPRDLSVFGGEVPIASDLHSRAAGLLITNAIDAVASKRFGQPVFDLEAHPNQIVALGNRAYQCLDRQFPYLGEELITPEVLVARIGRDSSEQPVIRLLMQMFDDKLDSVVPGPKSGTRCGDAVLLALEAPISHLPPQSRSDAEYLNMLARDHGKLDFKIANVYCTERGFLSQIDALLQQPSQSILSVMIAARAKEIFRNENDVGLPGLVQLAEGDVEVMATRIHSLSSPPEADKPREHLVRILSQIPGGVLELSCNWRGLAYGTINLFKAQTGSFAWFPNASF